MEKLEIIIITYNRLEHLRNTIKQLENCPCQNITILDNCSDDGTEQYCKTLNYKYIRHNRNIGGNANICRAYELAEKEYIWVLCDDDLFDFTYWQKLEDAINQKYDCIMVANYANPLSNIAQFLGQSTFVPSCVYKTKIINETVMQNMYLNIPFMFPQFALIAKILNDNLRYIILDNWIVKMQAHGGEETYSRGLNKDEIQPIYKNMFWQVGFLNCLRLLKDNNIKKQFIDFYKMPNARRLFFDQDYLVSENARLGSKWHLENIYSNLDFYPNYQRNFKRFI